MDNEAEMIEQQMREKREDLTKKLEQLEHQVVETVQSTTNAVTDTVENVKEVVEETVEAVKGTVEETVDTVKKTFDIRLQVETHPWLMLGGSVAVGFVAGRLLEGLTPPSRASQSHALPPPSYGEVRTNGGARSYRTAEDGPARREPASASTSESSTGGWLGALTEQFAPEINKIKGMAIGTALGLVRDLVKQSLPAELGGKLYEMIDDVTQKMGGEPFKGPVAPELTGQEESSQRQPDSSRTQTSGSRSGHGQSGVPPFNRL
jgi:ElaB/YqjD/DUF883 family membrane-anchored ribosome-binding protein